MCQLIARSQAIQVGALTVRAVLFLTIVALNASGSAIEMPGGVAATSAHAGLDSLPELLRDLPARETKPAGFQDLIPGTSTAAQISAKLGEPQEKNGSEDEGNWLYKVGPFPRVEMHIKGGQLQWVRAEFAQPRPLNEILTELKLTKYAAVPDYHPRGAIASLLYPERGLRVGVHPERQNMGLHIVLGVPHPDDFVLRAERDSSSQLRQQLADLQQALVMDPQHQRALVLRSQIWDECGFSELSLQHMSQAHQQLPDALWVRFELARLQIRHGQQQAAREHLQHIVQQPTAETLLTCRARQLIVDLDAAKALSESDPRPLIKELVQIIRTVAPLTKEGTFAQRVEARELILVCHLSAARVISESDWSKRGETAAKWLKNAESIAQTHVQLERTSPVVMLQVWHTATACQANLADQLDPAPVLNRMTKQVDQWLQANPDPLFQRQVRVLYASALLNSGRALQLRNVIEQAEEVASVAAEVIGPTAQQQPPHREAELLLGHAYFSIGAIHAVARNDHPKAATWYDKAEPLLSAPIPDWCFDRRVVAADQLVSMGLTNWALDEKQRGIELTEKGLELLRNEESNGRVPTESLTVALTNLAFMHGEVGNRDKAREFQELARRLDD